MWLHTATISFSLRLALVHGICTVSRVSSWANALEPIHLCWFKCEISPHHNFSPLAMTTWLIKILSTCLYILTSNSATWAINGYHKIHFLTFERAKRMKTSILSNDLPPMTASPWHFAPLQVGPHIWTSAARHSAHSACEWRPCIWACSWREVLQSGSNNPSCDMLEDFP